MFESILRLPMDQIGTLLIGGAIAMLAVLWKLDYLRIPALGATRSNVASPPNPQRISQAPQSAKSLLDEKQRVDAAIEAMRKSIEADYALITGGKAPAG